MSGLIEVSRVDSLLRELLQPDESVSVSLQEAHGRILREPVQADRDLPPFHRVMMDGYALRHLEAHSGHPLPVSGSAPAGMPRQTLPAGPAVLEVMTGAPLPSGSDTVVPYEDTLSESGAFRLRPGAAIEPGQYIHRKGSDFAKGTCLIDPGTVIRSPEIGTAASCGYTRLRVSRPPRVALFGTGDELVPVDAQPEAHQIRRSNAQVLAAALPLLPMAVDHLSDEAAREKDRLGEAIESAEIVIVSGAVSKGKRDWIPSFLNSVAECLFHGIAQRPGKPMGLWKSPGGCLVFALPGNPVSTLVCAHRHLIPYLDARMGRPSRSETVELAAPVTFERPLTLFLPVKKTGSARVEPRPVNNSGDFASLVGSDGFVELPSAAAHWPAGTHAPFFPWL